MEGKLGEPEGKCTSGISIGFLSSDLSFPTLFRIFDIIETLGYKYFQFHNKPPLTLRHNFVSDDMIFARVHPG